MRTLTVAVFLLLSSPLLADDYQAYLQAQQECFAAQQAALQAHGQAMARITGAGENPSNVASFGAGVYKYNQGVQFENYADAAAQQQNWVIARIHYNSAKTEYNNAKYIFDNTYNPPPPQP